MIGPVIDHPPQLDRAGMPVVATNAGDRRPRAVPTPLASDDIGSNRVFCSKARDGLPTDDRYVLKAVAVEETRQRTAAAAA